MIPTRTIKYEVYPSSNDKPVTIDQYERIIDGHHRYFSHQIFDTKMTVQQWFLSNPFQVFIEDLILDKEPRRDFLVLEDMTIGKKLYEMPIIVEKDNRFYVVRWGNSRVNYAILQQKDKITVQEILRVQR